MGAGTFRCVRLQPENLKHVWDVVRYGVIRSVPPHVPRSQETARSILRNLIAGKAQCWVLFDQDEESRKNIHAALVTAVETESLSGARIMVIWAVYAYRVTPGEGWELVRKALVDFARAQGCTSIMGTSSNPRVIALAEQMGAIKTTLLAREI